MLSKTGIMAGSLSCGSSLKKVFSLGVGSRILVATLFLVWRNVAKSYDTSAELTLPCLSSDNLEASGELDTRPVWGQALGKTIERTIVWDGVYYVRIAECGYEYEQAYAFLPALPILMRLLSQTIFSRLLPLLGLRATLALSGYLINIVAFVLAAYFLFRLTEQVLEDKRQAIQATALFCFNPASTFYSAIYSESLFTLCSFAGLFYFLKGAKWTAVALFGLSSGVRSNGVLHAGFILFQAMHRAYEVAYRQRRVQEVVPVILLALFQSAVVVGPFVAFQYYGFSQLCLWEGMLEIRPWCNATIPYLYGFVQSYYWDVGFLRYFEFKQLPNFFLASPMLSLAICAIGTYAKHHPALFFSLGLSASPSAQAKVAFMSLPNPKAPMTADGENLKESFEKEQSLISLSSQENLRNRKETKPNRRTFDSEAGTSNGRGFDSPAITCFLIQLCFMVATSMFVMHVQVSTRFLSVSPPIYWYGAYLMNHVTKHKFVDLMWTIFFCYVGVGSLLFINFYPFT